MIPNTFKVAKPVIHLGWVDFDWVVPLSSQFWWKSVTIGKASI